MAQTEHAQRATKPDSTGPGHRVLAIDATSSRADLLVEAVEAVRAAEAGHPLLLALAGAVDAEGCDGMLGARAVHDLGRWEKALRRLERAPVPMVATAAGLCTGPAAEALLVADHRIVTPDFRFQLAGRGPARPTMAIHRLAQQLGVAPARRLVLWGQSMSATDAVHVGLVDEIAGDLEVAHARAATRLNLTAERCVDLAVCRRLLLDAAVTDAETALGSHLAALDRLLRRHDGAGEGR